MKKAAPKSKQKTAQVCDCYSTGHKIRGAVALAGLFSCGLILGLTYRPEPVQEVRLDAQQCDAIANEIIKITTDGATTENVDVLNELNAAYSDGCAGRLVIIDRVASQNLMPEIISTCSRIEQLLTSRLHPESDTDYLAHLSNADTYSTLAERGCAENADMYKTMALRELEIATALKPEENMNESDTEIVIDTFKKLDMQREAQQFLDKIQQLTNPAIDFILQMEQVING